jgi:hypothetical protein
LICGDSPTAPGVEQRPGPGARGTARLPAAGGREVKLPDSAEVLLAFLTMAGRCRMLVVQSCEWSRWREVEHMLFIR